MEILIIQGEDTKKSYNRLIQLIKSAKFAGLEVFRAYENSEKIIDYLNSNSLFNKGRLIVIENIELVNQKIIKLISRRSKDLECKILIYHPGDVPISFFKKFPSSYKIEEYNPPKIVWSFLESFYPSNQKKILFLLENLTKKEPVEFIFSLLCRHLRDLYWIKIDPKTLNYPSWRKEKLKRQANKFGLKLLQEIIFQLSKIDVKTKTSNVNLKDELDFLIASKLE